MQDRAEEVRAKLATVRGWLEPLQAGAVRLRGTDWFAWLTAGGSNAVLLAAETGVAEALVTADAAVILTDEIEARRLRDEEIAAGFDWRIDPWAEPGRRERFVKDAVAGRPVYSDRPQAGETALPSNYRQTRLRLTDSEQARYRQVGRRAAAAMREALQAARPDWTEFELAGAGAEALWGQGLHPALTLAAGAERLPRYRHPTPTGAVLGERAMLVFCARGYGLYANLTRFVRFAPPSARQQRDDAALLGVEAAGLQVCRPGRTLAEAYTALAQAYAAAGFPNAIREHHQGGITGYLAREAIATPETPIELQTGMALAFNPSLSGAKLEDTFLLGADGLENLTLTPDWPSAMHDGRPRPLPLEAA